MDRKGKLPVSIGWPDETFLKGEGAFAAVSFCVVFTPRFENATTVTAFAAVAVCEAIECISEKTPQIKWVNDIFIGSKKVCGILTEAVTDFESGNLGWIVLGIGVNVSTHRADFPKELQNIAISIYPII